MKQLLASVAMVLLVTARLAVTQEPTIDWSRTAVAGAAAIPGQGPGGAAALQLRSPAAGASFHLVTIDHPAVAAPGYAVTGELRYDAVEGQGYLEMWSVFPDSGHFFSRTLAPAGPGGPLAALHGDSKWRRFQLPFLLNGTHQLPSRLEINLVLPGQGTVWLGPLQLERLPLVASAGSAWWNGPSGNFAGALGSLLGLVGGLVGVLAGRGKARRLVLSLIVGMVAVGVGLALLGGLATLIAQPRDVWYPLVLVGGLSAVVGLSVLPAVRRRYAMEELRRIQARDA